MAAPKPQQSTELDILAIAAHRDDIEQTCGGTLLKAAQRGQRAGILDLTRGEMGTRGTAEDREREAMDAARLLRVGWREALDIPDGRVENTWVNRLKIAQIIRRTKPRVVILPYWEGRHPDHYTCATVGYEACFIAGLKKLEIPRKMQEEGVQAESLENLPPYRPFKIVYATLYHHVRPTFVVDISEQFETRLAALMAYKSQFSDQEEGSNIFPMQAEIHDRIHSMARFYGMLAGVKYAEPFLQKEIGLVEDLLSIPVQSI